MNIKWICLLFFLFAPVLAKAASGKVPYPFGYCLISGEKFGGMMGEPVAIDYKNHEIRFCCKGCIKQFYSNPEFFLKQIDEVASRKQ